MLNQPRDNFYLLLSKDRKKKNFSWFCQSWDNWDQSLSQTDRQILYTVCSRLVSWWNLYLPTRFAFRGITKMAFWVLVSRCSSTRQCHQAPTITVTGDDLQHFLRKFDHTALLFCQPILWLSLFLTMPSTITTLLTSITTLLYLSIKLNQNIL